MHFVLYRAFEGPKPWTAVRFEDLLENLCESIVRELTQTKSSNQIALAIWEGFKRQNYQFEADGLQECTGKDFLDLLLKHWHDIGPIVKTFYK